MITLRCVFRHQGEVRSAKAPFLLGYVRRIRVSGGRIRKTLASPSEFITLSRVAERHRKAHVFALGIGGGIQGMLVPDKLRRGHERHRVLGQRNAAVELQRFELHIGDDEVGNAPIAVRAAVGAGVRGRGITRVQAECLGALADLGQGVEGVLAGLAAVLLFQEIMPQCSDFARCRRRRPRRSAWS